MKQDFTIEAVGTYNGEKFNRLAFGTYLQTDYTSEDTIEYGVIATVGSITALQVETENCTVSNIKSAFSGRGKRFIVTYIDKSKPASVTIGDVLSIYIRQQS